MSEQGGALRASADTMSRSSGKRILIFSAASVAATWLIIRYLARLDVERRRLARANPGNLLYTEVSGSGDPVVFIAGFQGSTRYWQSARLQFEKKRIFVDLLGFGRSPWPAGVAYSLDDQVAALRRTLLSLGATKDLVLVAHSFGTLIAAAYASHFPREVRRLVLLGTPVFSDATDAAARIREMSPLAALFMLNRKLAEAACTTMCALRPLILPLAPFFRPDVTRDVAHDALLHHYPAVGGATTILLDHPIEASLLAGPTPTTFIHATSDTVTSIATVRELAARTGAQVIEVAGGHHDYLQTGLSAIVDMVNR